MGLSMTTQSNINKRGDPLYENSALQKVLNRLLEEIKITQDKIDKTKEALRTPKYSLV